MVGATGISESSSKSPQSSSSTVTVALDLSAWRAEATTTFATASSTIGSSSLLVSIVDSGTGHDARPQRAEEPGQEARLVVHDEHDRARCGGRRATARARWARHILPQHVGVRQALVTADDGDSITAARLDVAIDQPGRRVVGHVTRTRTYSNSTGLPLMPVAGGAIHPAILPGSVTGRISERTKCSSSPVGSHVARFAAHVSSSTRRPSGLT